MKINIHVYGGFAGTNEVTTVDTASLSAAQAEKVNDTLKKILDLLKDHAPAGLDFVHYEILVDDGKNQPIISFSDDASEKAQQLVKLVVSLKEATPEKKPD